MKVSLYEELYREARLRKEKLDAKLEEVKKEREGKEMEGVTFKPQMMTKSGPKKQEMVIVENVSKPSEPSSYL